MLYNIIYRNLNTTQMSLSMKEKDGLGQIEVGCGRGMASRYYAVSDKLLYMNVIQITGPTISTDDYSQVLGDKP